MPVFVGMKGKLGGIGSWASRQASSLYKPSHEHQNLNFYFSLVFFFWQIFFDLSNLIKYQHGVSDSVSLVCSSMYSITFLCPIMLIRWIFIFGLFKKYFNFFGEWFFCSCVIYKYAVESQNIWCRSSSLCCWFVALILLWAENIFWIMLFFTSAI